MSIIKTIKEWRANHKIASAIMDGATVFAAGNAGAAAIDALVQPETPIITEVKADFYDGCRGPNLLQLDQRLVLSEGTPNYTLLPKMFVDTDDESKMGVFGVTPLNYTPGKKPTFGAGIGGFYDLGKVSLLGVVPVVYLMEGEVTNINPTLYATIMAENFLIDPRVSYLASIAGDNIVHNVTFGATLGYKIDNVILGVDVGTGFDPANTTRDQLRDYFAYQGIIRIDLDEEHKNWIQAYLGKDTVGLGFRSNFDWK